MSVPPKKTELPPNPKNKEAAVTVDLLGEPEDSEADLNKKFAVIFKFYLNSKTVELVRFEPSKKYRNNAVVR